MIQHGITILLCLAIICGLWIGVNRVITEYSGWRRLLLVSVCGIATGIFGLIALWAIFKILTH